MGIELTPRLAAAASLVRGGGILADIGTDHGYLPAHLVMNGTVNSAIAADVRKMPLKNAENTVRAYNLAQKITLKLSDGLDAFSPDEADEFVFAGMGGTLIAELMAKAPWVKNENLHFIFQPQSRAEELREYLWQNGFAIGTELAVSEGERFYICFEAVYTGEVRKYTAAETFLGNLPHNECAVEFIRRQYLRMRKKYDALIQQGETDETKRLFEITEALREFSNV